MNEFEIIQHPQIHGLSLFFDTVDYRTSHLHPELELLLVADGTLEVLCGQNSFFAGPGTPVLFNPGQPHEFRKHGEKSCTFLCLQLDLGIFAQSYPAVGQLAFSTNLPAQHLSAQQLFSLQSTVFSMMEIYLRCPPVYELQCVGQVALLLQLLLANAPCRRISGDEAADLSRRNARLERLLAFVDENYMHKLRLADFAAQEGLSLGYLSHFVKDTMNQTFQEYVATVRFNAACKRIAATEERLLDICIACGFSDYRYFSAAFRKRLGLTPEQYRRHCQPAPPFAANIHHSLHSLERFYTREQSLLLLAQYRPR